MKPTLISVEVVLLRAFLSRKIDLPSIRIEEADRVKRVQSHTTFPIRNNINSVERF